MLKTSRILDDVRVASPCSASWEEMVGSDRVRYCRHCQKNVYNLSDMSRAEAEKFVSQRRQPSCIQFHRRSDGTMLTDDCPVGLRVLRRAARRSWALLAGSLVAAMGLLVGGNGASSAKRLGAMRQLEPLASFFEWLNPPSIATPEAVPGASPGALSVELPPEPRGAIRGEMCIPARPAPTVNNPVQQ